MSSSVQLLVVRLVLVLPVGLPTRNGVMVRVPLLMVLPPLMTGGAGTVATGCGACTMRTDSSELMRTVATLSRPGPLMGKLPLHRLVPPL